jgi:signal transduction histidine kinase
MNNKFGISKWKATLVLVGIIVLAISTWFTNYLAENLSENERYLVALYRDAQEQLNNLSGDLEADLTFFQDITIQADNIPVIVTDLNDVITSARAFGSEERDTNMVFLEGELADIMRNGLPPIVNSPGGYKLYYKQSQILTLMTYFPLIQLLLIGAFILVGFVGLSAAKRAQQNRVWVGMAKETAHQLGTPISAIVAWIELLKEEATNAQGEIIEELRNDVKRLEMIADRFSKIGSSPDLHPANIYEELEKGKDYMSRRASRHVNFDFPKPEDQTPLTVNVNQHLFHWVLENLLRNALDAMDGEGLIKAVVSQEGKYICVDISDTGSGIPAAKMKTVFEPGYTTKQRGWGRGLSLAKRIIENYHAGKIFVKKSKPGEGTTFSIKLPKK